MRNRDDQDEEPVENSPPKPYVQTLANLFVKISILIIIAVFVIFFEALLKWLTGLFKP